MEKDAKKKSLRRNLCDAGCDAALADKFMKFHEEGEIEEQLRLLKTHRAALLKTIHEHQKKIDCLDYLVFSLTQATT
ncbi:MAG: hypothetical protein LIQ31_11890 [Planctomycetes bacterium]|nr:hypothetical protein [Planctomycetota bacterium]